ncbi:oleate hydratase [Pleomorphomonas sp. PLEO]|uniref:oleate hydratase n=1 Tax=Pleomorphomonas sp. PLEO TaxID=3239306 RepID=UPI00351DDAF6
MNIYKTMYRAAKPDGIETRKAYIVGGGVAGLAAAAFLTDDAGMPGENITIFEKLPVVGGSMDGVRTPNGYQNRGERELEPYMECLWYLCSKVPSLERPGRSVLDDIVDFNKDEPIHSECRALVQQGLIAKDIHDFKLPASVNAKMFHLLTSPEEGFEDLTIEDYFGTDSALFKGNFWLCFHTMLAFKPWHSVMELRRYMTRFAPNDFRIEYLEGILHTKYNEYDAIIKPIEVWLRGKGVKIVSDCPVTNIDLDPACNAVQRLQLKQNRIDTSVAIAPTDLVFVTNGSMTQNSGYGDNQTVAPIDRSTQDRGVFTLWERLAKKHKKFGQPQKFIGNIDKTMWASFFPTIKGYPQFVARLEVLTGSKAGTGGAISIKDSAWQIGLILHHKPFYPGQADDEEVLWGNGLFSERIGNYVKKTMLDCTGEEIMTEVLYHLGLLEMKDELFKHMSVSTCVMPYINSQFMPRKVTDRPAVVPKGCTNLGFIGQFVEVKDDAVFTVETSVRTAMEAVYTLTKLARDVPEVYPSQYDIRCAVDHARRFLGVSGEFTKADIPSVNPFLLFGLKTKIAAFLNGVPHFPHLYQGHDRSVPDKVSVLHPQYPLEK